jgi:hypothetical protein
MPNNDGSLLWEVKRDAFARALKEIKNRKKHKEYSYAQINYAANELLLHQEHPILVVREGYVKPVGTTHLAYEATADAVRSAKSSEFTTFK